MGAMSLTVTVAAPLAPGDNWLGAVNCRIAGGVSSILSVTEVGAWFPAWSCTVPVMIWPIPCDETTCAGEQEAIGERPLLQVNVTVTLVLFHPAELAVGDTEAVMVGSASSRL